MLISRDVIFRMALEWELKVEGLITLIAAEAEP